MTLLAAMVERKFCVCRGEDFFPREEKNVTLLPCYLQNVGKQACNVTEVHECKVGFPVFLTDSCTTTDYLLEIGH